MFMTLCKFAKKKEKKVNFQLVVYLSYPITVSVHIPVKMNLFITLLSLVHEAIQSTDEDEDKNAYDDLRGKSSFKFCFTPPHASIP